MLATRTPSGRPSPPAAAHRSPVTLQDLLDDLLWPHLLRSWKLALAPGRVALSFLAVLALGGFYFLLKSAMGAEAYGRLESTVKGKSQSIFGAFTGARGAGEAVHALFIETPADLLRSYPVLFVVVLPVVLLIWCVIGGAVSRSCACEVSLRAALPWRRAVGFGVKKSLALFAALAGPLLLVWTACLVLWLLGLALFTTKVMGILGGLTFVAPLLLCVVIAVALFAYMLAHPLLIPAVACEGTDSFDAVQRCYAYTLSRPGRLVVYTFIAALGMIPAIVVVSAIGWAAVTIAVSVTSAPSAVGQTESEHYLFTHRMIGLWIALVVAVGFAYFISLYFCAATTLYLVVRRLVDGQDITELWMPPTTPSPASVPPAAVSPPIPEKADYT